MQQWVFSAALCRGLIEAAGRGSTSRRGEGFPRLYAAASLKPSASTPLFRYSATFSAALCRGLIEAACLLGVRRALPSRFPRLYAAASLKRSRPAADETQAPQFSAALCRGLIEARSAGASARRCPRRFPRLYAAASLKRARFDDFLPSRMIGFPRLYAAASLKRRRPGMYTDTTTPFSAALCRGLIEAGHRGRPRFRPGRLFSAALCRGLIEAEVAEAAKRRFGCVFRGFMPRPH